jgi:hypothetical protein
VDRSSPGSPADASFEAELLARTRHCQLFVFDHTGRSLPRALSTPASLAPTLGEFYSAWDASSPESDEHDFWDSRGIAQRSHFKPYRIAGFDAHASGDNPKTYTLETLMRQNGECARAPEVITIFMRLTLARTYAYRHVENRPRRMGVRCA